MKLVTSIKNPGWINDIEISVDQSSPNQKFVSVTQHLLSLPNNPCMAQIRMQYLAVLKALAAAAADAVRHGGTQNHR